MYFGRGALLELGFADSRGALQQVPQGTRLYEITPFGSSGNYFVNLDQHSSRQQWLANVILPTAQAFGAHQLKFGVDFERESFHQEVLRHDYQVLRLDQSVARYVTFAGNPFQQRRNFEGAQYVIDRWTPREGLTIEGGVRADWDQVVRDVLWSPRVSAAWAPHFLRDTKLSAGFGIFYDALSLGTLTRHQDQVSYSTFFDPAGVPVRGPVETAFLLNEHGLRVPRYRTMSAAVERKLPFDFYGKAAWTRRLGSRGVTFVNELDADLAGGLYLLRNWRHDTYQSRGTAAAPHLRPLRVGPRLHAVERAHRCGGGLQPGKPHLRAPGRPGRSRGTRPTASSCGAGRRCPPATSPAGCEPSWGETDAAYLVEYRTGFPFSVINDEAAMVGPPNGRRYPDYFNINLHFERKFRALHYLWAWRFGFNNLTNNGNPNVVNNNIDSPQYPRVRKGTIARLYSAFTLDRPQVNPPSGNIPRDN